ncbi:amino acid deaminase/aldolase [Dictyobacter aurantiacus]|uniref:Amino acid aldolase n=1 Tax=Dictyobacter aurantiacus TaxID=1936993 RepID=A0A401ZMG9_9CHLR|nr:amino acid deaminase/aldolase [Dictyobacter aurantiacus]GCE08053.1 amino acid aldolase [Dictyobacter aurantiacus]
MSISADPPASSPAQVQEARDYQYYKKILAGRALPLAYVDLDLLDQNIQAVAERAHGKRIRVASKSVRSVWVLKHIMAADPCFQGIMCFTAREAVYLASQGFDDLLLGYPSWHEQDIAAVAAAIKAGTHITLMIDSVAHITRIEQVASQHGVPIPVCLDLDMALHLPGLHVGVWRSSLRTPEQIRPVLESIAASQHVLLDGIMGYEAQVAGLGDNYPKSAVKNALVRYLKGRSIREAAARRSTAISLIEGYQLSPLRFVNGGGTGSVHTTREEEAVTEITVGSGFYAPALFDNYRDFRYQPAAGFAIEIVRRPTPTIYTCLGGGYIASGTVGRDRLPQPYLPVGARLEPLEGAGEVQTPIHYTGPENLQPGDPILLRHSKAGELCERFNSLLLISHGTIVDEVTTYRGDGQCFL